MTGEEIVRRNTELQKKKSVWLQLWQICGEYIHQLKIDFTGQTPPGSMLNDNLFDSTAVDANTKSAAALIGTLWQSGSRSFQLVPPKSLKASAKVKAYFEKINEVMRSAFDDPKAGFAVSYEEYMSDQCAIGTSAMACYEGTDSDLSFEAWGVDEMSIALGFGGRAEVIYREYCWELRRVVAEYGVENLSRRYQDLAKSNKLDEKVRIICAIEPRKDLKPGNLSNLNMPIATYHVEKETKHIIKESGYSEMPASIGMFYRRRGEDYARSMGMKALPDILELNATKEIRLLAIEKALNPPVAVFNDSLLGNQKIDMSSDAVNVMKASGKLKGGAAVQVLYDGSNIREGDKSIEELKQAINGHFLLDRLIDFNNSTEMTLGEVQYRAQLRGESLGSIFNRQITVLQQLIERATSVQFRNKKLGVIEGSIEHKMAQMAGEEPIIIPDEVAKLIMSGKDFYEIKFASPAARMMEAEEANGVRRTWEFAASIVGVDPEIMDGLDADKSLEIIGRNVGAPPEILVAKEKIEKIRAERLKMMEQQQAQQQAQAQADVAATEAAAGGQEAA